MPLDVLVLEDRDDGRFAHGRPETSPAGPGRGPPPPPRGCARRRARPTGSRATTSIRPGGGDGRQPGLDGPRASQRGGRSAPRTPARASVALRGLVVAEKGQEHLLVDAAPSGPSDRDEAPPGGPARPPGRWKVPAHDCKARPHVGRPSLATSWPDVGDPGAARDDAGPGLDDADLLPRGLVERGLGRASAAWSTANMRQHRDAARGRCWSHPRRRPMARLVDARPLTLCRGHPLERQYGGELEVGSPAGPSAAQRARRRAGGYWTRAAKLVRGGWRRGTTPPRPRSAR